MKNALDIIPVFRLLAVRFTVGGILLAALCGGRWKKFTPDYLCRGAIVGGMLAWYEAGFGSNFPGLYAMNAFTVGLGELAACYGLGLVLLTVLPRVPYLRGRMAPQRL